MNLYEEQHRGIKKQVNKIVLAITDKDRITPSIDRFLLTENEIILRGMYNTKSSICAICKTETEHKQITVVYDENKSSYYICSAECGYKYVDSLVKKRTGQ